MNEIIVTQSEESGDFKKFVENLASRRVASVDSCKLCNSPNRAAAEAMADRSPNIAAIKRFIESKGEEISYNAISNHINNHYIAEHDEANLSVFAEKLSKWSKVPKSDEHLLRRYIETLDMEAMHLISKNADLDIAERRKNDELFVKLCAQLDAFREQLKKLEGEKTEAEIVVTSVNKIINLKIQGTNDASVKKALIEVVEALKKALPS